MNPVHFKKHDFDVYIGRKADCMHFGNPWSHKGGLGIKVDTREQSIENFRKWLDGSDFQDVEPERRKWVIENIGTLKGKILGCWCDYPREQCHGSVYIELLDGKIPVSKDGFAWVFNTDGWEIDTAASGGPPDPFEESHKGLSSIKFLPENDGVDHINIYSKGKTELGRFLTNFAHHPTFTPDGYFASIEGYWYWLSCKNDKLRHVWGFKAKELGRELRAKDWVEDPEFKGKIKAAIKNKVENSPLKDTFKNSTLPFAHYYVYSGKVVEVPKSDWIIEYITQLREEMNKQKL
jgi:hypothetical protein